MARQYWKSVIGPQRASPRLDENAADYLSIMNAQMSDITKNMRNIIKATQDSGPDIIYDALKPTFDKAYDYCPEDTGALRESGYLQVEQTADGQTTAEMGFGKGNVPSYTIFVHERTDLQHAPPTSAKFLQRALEEDADEIPARIAAGYADLST